MYGYFGFRTPDICNQFPNAAEHELDLAVDFSFSLLLLLEQLTFNQRARGLSPWTHIAEAIP